jgi:hypothetical protein
MAADHNCYKRTRFAVEALAGPGELPERLAEAVAILLPLLMDDSPPEELSQYIVEARRALTREEPPMSVAEQCRAARKIIDLFVAVGRIGRNT